MDFQNNVRINAYINLRLKTFNLCHISLSLINITHLSCLAYTLLIDSLKNRVDFKVAIHLTIVSDN